METNTVQTNEHLYYDLLFTGVVVIYFVLLVIEKKENFPRFKEVNEF